MATSAAPRMRKKKPANLMLPTSPTSGKPPLSPLALLHAELPKYQGEQRARLQEFIFNKGRFLQSQDMNPDAFERIREIAHGEGRSVWKVKHRHTDLTLIQKVVRYDNRPETFSTLANELKLLHECNSPEIVQFYGSFIQGSDIYIIMEYMDGGCLDDVLHRVGRLPESVLAPITAHVLRGLEYLESNRMIHRDLKPANILVNTKGEVKLCDFGVSRKLFETLKAKTFVGTMRYMSPERMAGEEYNYKSDIWSLGISIIELATGFYPMAADKPSGKPIAPLKNPKRALSRRKKVKENLAIFDMVEEIVRGASPRLPAEGGFSADITDFVDKCLQKDPERRPTFEQLQMHPWLLESECLDLAGWVRSTMPEVEVFADSDDEDCEYEDVVRVS